MGGWLGVHRLLDRCVQRDWKINKAEIEAAMDIDEGMEA